MLFVVWLCKAPSPYTIRINPENRFTFGQKFKNGHKKHRPSQAGASELRYKRYKKSLVQENDSRLGVADDYTELRRLT